MIAIDIGNTTLVMARVSGGRVAQRRILPVMNLQSRQLEEHLLKLNTAQKEPVVIASVVPATLSKVDQALARMRLPAAIHLEHAVHHVIDHNLETPRTTGIDRLLAARAARDLYAQARPVVVVQAGSAVTVDLVDDHGCFQGGVIMPGPGMWLRALATAAGIPELDPRTVDWQAHGPGRSTAEALGSGLVAGLSGAVEKAVEMTAGKYEQPLVVMTGGWAERILPALGIKVQHAPDLVLSGIGLAGSEVV